MGRGEILRERVLVHLIASDVEGTGGVEDFDAFQIPARRNSISATSPCNTIRLDS
jgi:hypothetical protein